MLLNLTKDIRDDILHDALAYWIDKDIYSIPIIKFPTLIGNRIKNQDDISDAHGLSYRGMDFMAKECRSNFSLLLPSDLTILDYIDYMRNRHNVINISGSHYMDCNGFIQWHTNQHERPGYYYRLYATYNELPGSVFKYILPDTDNVITIKEPVGWYVKLFSIEHELLHCVIANGPRFSFGLFFRR